MKPALVGGIVIGAIAGIGFGIMTSDTPPVEPLPVKAKKEPATPAKKTYKITQAEPGRPQRRAYYDYTATLTQQRRHHARNRHGPPVTDRAD